MKLMFQFLLLVLTLIDNTSAASDWINVKKPKNYQTDKMAVLITGITGMSMEELSGYAPIKYKNVNKSDYTALYVIYERVDEKRLTVVYKQQGDVLNYLSLKIDN